MVEVRQGTLTWIAVEQEEDEEDEEEEEAGGGRRRKEAGGGRRRKEEATDIKSNNSHLAGGEQLFRGGVTRNLWDQCEACGSLNPKTLAIDLWLVVWNMFYFP